MSEPNWVYLDGCFLTAEEARISPFDRGFLFGQAAYEVTAVFNGKLIDFDAHMERLDRTLSGLEIPLPDLDLKALHEALIKRNGLREGVVYLHVTAGAPGPRDFYGPETFKPSVFICATHKQLIGDIARDGLTAISVEDTRWKRRDFKTTQLVSQSLAYRAARRAGSETAIFLEDGLITEAASANLWMVTQDGRLVTRSLSPALLAGITRRRLIRLLGDHVSTIEERAFSLEELLDAAEAFTSSTGVVIAPVLSVDGKQIGDGTPGPVTRQVQTAYYQYIGADLDRLDWL
jgi:D-alanine transaminase